jgi:hypothetical protein
MPNASVSDAKCHCRQQPDWVSFSTREELEESGLVVPPVILFFLPSCPAGAEEDIPSPSTSRMACRQFKKLTNILPSDEPDNWIYLTTAAEELFEEWVQWERRGDKDAFLQWALETCRKKMEEFMVRLSVLHFGHLRVLPLHSTSVSARTGLMRGPSIRSLKDVSFDKLGLTSTSLTCLTRNRLFTVSGQDHAEIAGNGLDRRVGIRKLAS